MTAHEAKAYHKAVENLIGTLKRSLTDEGMDERQTALLSALTAAVTLNDALRVLGREGVA